MVPLRPGSDLDADRLTPPVSGIGSDLVTTTNHGQKTKVAYSISNNYVFEVMYFRQIANPQIKIQG
jgi:hypothetical protein